MEKPTFIPLPRPFYERPTELVAHDLLGKLLIRKHGDHLLTGIITETEAYGADNDPASHAYRGKTHRNSPMFETVGHSYIYFTYGMHHCFNVVARNYNEKAGGVLIRSIQPTIGIPLMEKHRGRKNNIADGPGKLCQALALTQMHNQLDLTEQQTIWITDGILIEKKLIIQTTRIGISQGIDLPWRFVVNNN